MIKAGFTLAGAMLLAVAMWCYADFILVPAQVADAARTGRPRGNLSDLYPRWLAARELLLHHRDPYSDEVTREIQAGYYGRPLDSQRPSDPKDQQGFAYPVYVVFLLAPSVRLPFAVVQEFSRVVLFFFIAASVLLWLQTVEWRFSATSKLTAIALVLGSYPAVQAIKLQQLSALVCFLLAASAAFIVNRRLTVAGVLLGFATIKPQLALGFAAWMLVWSSGDWRSRRRLVWSFLATCLLLTLAGEVLLPGWIGRFRQATRAYLQYAGRSSLLDLALTPAWGRAVAAVLISAVAYVCWRGRRSAPRSAVFLWTMALVLTTILVVIPTFAPYNQLLIVPAFLLVVQHARWFWKSGPWARFCLILVLLIVLLPWLAAVTLDLAILFFPPMMVERGWAIPLWTSWAMPFPLLAAVWQGARRALREDDGLGEEVAVPL